MTSPTASSTENSNFVPRELYEAEVARRSELEARLAKLEKDKEQLLVFARDLNRTYQQLQRKLSQMTELHSLAVDLAMTLDTDRIILSVLNRLPKLLPIERASLVMLDEGLLVHMEATQDGKLSRSFVQDSGLYAAGPELLTAPLMASEGEIGMIVVRYGNSSPADTDADLLGTVAVNVAFALEKARAYERSHRQAITDEMTGLYNYRYLKKALVQELERANRLGYPVGILMVDIDDFKAINDHYGHLAGDQILVAVAHTMRNALRKSDTLARYGGEEFAALLPGCRHEHLAVVGEKIRSAVAGTTITLDNGTVIRGITVSVGAASSPPLPRAPELVLAAADANLLKAKASGKNRVSVDSDVLEQHPT
jgi:diguanylate cyclase (GGDEF)-like protein